MCMLYTKPYTQTLAPLSKGPTVARTEELKNKFLENNAILSSSVTFLHVSKT